MIRRIAAWTLTAVLLFLLIPGTAAKAAGLSPYTKKVRYGSSGSVVAELQEALSFLGYYQVKIDGNAGNATVRAIKAFQTDQGLDPDGVAGPATWSRLSDALDAARAETPAAHDEGTEVSQSGAEEAAAGAETSHIGGDAAPEAAEVSGPGNEDPVYAAAEEPFLIPAGEASAAPDLTPLTVTVRYGMRGESVRALQEALIALGYRPGTPDGVCGNGTTAAIRAFQKDFNLNADGVAGRETLAQINASLQAKGRPQEKPAVTWGVEVTEAVTLPDPEAAEEPPAVQAGQDGDNDLRIPASALSGGDRGDDVYALQKALFFLGYYNLSLDGSYGPGTLNAVRAFQGDHGLTTDGQAGPKTLQALDKALKKALSAPANAEMTAWMDNLASENGVKNGAAVITKDGEILLAWGWGGTDEDTCFRIASVTKWVTAIGLMTLYDQGLIDLDEDISVYLPFEVRNPGFAGEKVTARMLLNHTSSLRPDATDYHPEWSRIGTNGYDPIFMENLQPGTMYSYADFDGALLGSLIEAITGESVQTYMERKVFKPLGLTAAYTPKLLPTGASAADLLSTSGTVQISVKKDTEREFNLYADPVDNCGYTVGRLFINASSLSVLAQMMIDGGAYGGVRILNENTVRLMESDTTPAQSPYGLGQARLNQFTGGTWYGHQGRYGGLSSNVYYQKENGITVVLILNGYDYRLENNIVLPAVSILSNMDALMTMAGATVD